MRRALSWSLAGHAVFILSFLLFSATRQPLKLPQVARPVRLVAYLEPNVAPRRPAAVPVVPERAPAAPRLLRPPAESIPLPTAAPPAKPDAAPRIALPVREKPRTASRTPPAETRPALSERLARRLASAAPVQSRPVEIAPPQVNSLPPLEAVATAPSPDRPGPGPPPASPDAVMPVGHFPHAWYLAVLKEKVFSRWAPPSEYFQSNLLPTALVSFRIDRAGRIGGIGLKESSGSARFDKSALAAVQGLGKVTALPEQYREESLDVVIRFQNQN